MKNLSKNILGKIKKEKIKPISKWNFLFKKSFIWSLFGVSVILGGFAFGSILAQINSTEWEIRHQITDSFTHFIFMTLPYLWIIFMLGFSALAYYYLRHTSKGYKYSTVIVINSSLLISVLFGTTLFATGVSNRVENTMQERLPFYREVLDQRTKMWIRPEEGLIAGKYLGSINQNQIKIIDVKKNIWVVDISEVTVKQELALTKNVLVKILGKKEGEFKFKAREIFFWNKKQNFMCDPNNPDTTCLRPLQKMRNKMKENNQRMRTNN